MDITRRTFLVYLGSVLSGLACSPRGDRSALAPPQLPPTQQQLIKWTYSPVPYPLPLPSDHLPSEQGVVPYFVVQDTLVVPENFEWSVIAQWGDVIGPADKPEHQITFGYNCDYTTLIPRRGKRNEYWLCVNHEYVSLRPWLQGLSEVRSINLPSLTVLPNTKKIILSSRDSKVWTIDHLDLTAEQPKNSAVRFAVETAKKISQYILEEMGVSILHVKLDDDGSIHLLNDSLDHKRITTTKYLNCTSRSAPRISGPVGKIVKNVKGTACNCSGGTTPWGTLLTCEENTQDIVAEYITPDGVSFPPPYFSAEGKGDVLSLPVGWQGMGAASESPLDSRSFGWVAEIDPETGGLVKHSSLGRFRHENITLTAKEGQPLVAYMGDDRRGGHVWRFRSADAVKNPDDPRNSHLLEKGTLYVAQFNSDYSGRWIPLTPETKLTVPEPQHTAAGKLLLPNRPEGGAITVTQRPAGGPAIWVESYIRRIEKFTGKRYDDCTLGDLIRVPTDFQGNIDEFKQAIILLDAPRMANAVGGTPCARPEDLEVDPEDNGVFIAFTEASSSEDGSPDTRIFIDSKGDTSRQYGAIFKLHDESNYQFRWRKLITSGEIAEGGSGLACADNLAIDTQGDLWVVCDITTQYSNQSVTREETTAPGTKNFLGVFGSSCLFRFQRTADGFAFPECFATGPAECELTGPTFTPGGKSLVLSVQHPGEHNGIRYSPCGEETRRFGILSPAGELYFQEREVPIGSNFPHKDRGRVPRPAVVCIKTKKK